MWTVANIITEFRDLTGRKSTNQISDSAVLEYVNRYYQYTMPVNLKFKIPELKGWLEFTTADGEGTFNLSSAPSGALPFVLPLTFGIEYGVINVSAPLHINDEPANLWLDEDRFYSEYPPDYDTEGVPTDVLFFGRALLLRPIPDDEYPVRMQAEYAPNALTLTGSPMHPIFAPVAAYGSAIMFLDAKGESDIAQERVPMFQHYLGVAQSYIIRQLASKRRPKGGRF